MHSPYSKYEYSRPRSPRSCRIFNADAASQRHQGGCGVEFFPTYGQPLRYACLREQFRDVLFVRTRSGMEPTSIALAAAAAVDDIVRVYATQLSDPGKFDPKVSRREFALAASDVGHLLVLPRLFSEIASEAPRVKFTAVPLSQRPLIEELQSGEVDLALGGFPNLFAGVLEQTLYQEEYVCLVRKDHPTIKRRMTLAQFKDCVHVIVSTRTLGHIHQDSRSYCLRFARPSACELSLTASLLAR